MSNIGRRGGVVFATMTVLATAAHAEPPVTVTGGARSVERYACSDERRTVVYVNAEPDHLAIVPVAGTDRIFVNVIAASGARYVSGRYVWWTKGSEASLYDVMRGPDAAPVATCRDAAS